MNNDLYADDRPSPSPGVTSAPPPEEPPRQGRRRGRVTVTGTARGVQVTSVQAVSWSPQAGQKQLLSFKVERHDNAGERLTPIAVQLRATVLHGQVGDGDQVRVTGRWSHGTLRARRIDDLSTLATVVGKGNRGRWLVLLLAPTLVAAVLAVGFGWFSHARPQPTVPPPVSPVATTAAQSVPSTTSATATTTTSASASSVRSSRSAAAGGSRVTRTVPNLAGQNVADATQQLEGMGLEVATVSADSASPEGTVTGTDPRAGNVVAPGSVVTLRVSRGPQLFVVPNLVGMTVDQAGQALTDVGWQGQTLTTTDVSVPDPNEQGQIMQQAPDAGQQVPVTQPMMVMVATLPLGPSQTPGGG